MHLPTNINAITVSGEGYEVPYPPLGFYEFSEHQLGNGDVFGLYSPIGHEDREPIVAETYHDEWSIRPHFSSPETFLAIAGEDDGEHIGTPDAATDPESPSVRLQRAREAIQSSDVDTAITLLEAAVSRIPEYTEAQSLLFAQYRRVNRTADAIRTAIQAVISPPCFGVPPAQLAVWLSRQDSCPPGLESDPIWKARSRLSLHFGGTKENEVYGLLRKSIEEYLDQSEFIKAMTLMQTYGEHMYGETVSFQERYGFNPREFVQWQRDVAASKHGKPRDLSIPR